MNENLIKAIDSASFLDKDLRAAHSDACQHNQFLEVILIDLIDDAAKIKTKLSRVRLALNEIDR